MPIKKSELYSSIWKSCDELRGGMDASQYKDYVLPLLFLRFLICEIIVKLNLRIDWTKPHREDVKAAVMAVKMVLRRRKVRAEDFDFILKRVMDQAAALYEAWPVGM
jgi:type I restriction-modification system DNA methylase subunit